MSRVESVGTRLRRRRPADGRLRVLHVVDSLGIGGAERLEVTFADAVRDQPVELAVVALDQRSITCEDQVRATGAHVEVWPRRYGALRDAALILVRLVIFCLRWRPDVIQTSLTHANGLGTLAGRITRVPVVAVLHGTAAEMSRHSTRVQRLETWALATGASAVIAVGQGVADSHASRFRGRVPLVVPNAVAAPSTDAGYAARLRADILGSDKELLMLWVGRLVPEKGVPHLLDAIVLLGDRHPNALLAMVGLGDLEQEVRQLLRDKDLENRMVMLGWRPDVSDLMAAADVFVTASLWEGLPVSVLEAMAAGLPVVGTEVGDLPEVLGDGRGVLVPPGSAHDLAVALDAVLADPERRRGMAAAAQEYVEARHGARSWVSSLLQVYRDVRPAPVAGPSAAMETV